MRLSRLPWLLLFVGLPCFAAEPEPLVTGRPDQVSAEIARLMQDREYAGAVTAIEKAIKDEKGPGDYLWYLKGRALHLQKKYDEAAKAFDAVNKLHAKSAWARRARFGKALALVRKGDFRAAEQIYRAEADYLLSSDRKQEIADIYLQFADAYFKPDKPEQKPNYQKARSFYEQALKAGPKDERRMEVELRVAECFQNLKNWGAASGAFAKFIADHTKGENERPGDKPLAPAKLEIEARFRLGEVQLAQSQWDASRRTWEDLLAGRGKSDNARIAEATFNLAKTFQVPTPGSDEALSRGVAALESFLKKFPAHKLASEAHLNIARSYVHRGRHEDAVKSLGRFLAEDRYAKTDEAPLARQLLGQAQQRQKKFAEALKTWREYLAKHPAHRAWAQVQRDIITTEFLMAAEKQRLEQYGEARNLFSAFLMKYPLDGRAASIMYALAAMQFEQEKWDAAIAEWRKLVSKYPGTNESSAAQFQIAFTLEMKLEKLDEALKEYRKVTWGGHAWQAKQRIAQLSAANMTVATPRVFRSNETAKLKLTSRNIEEVTVEVYSVDMETYFRKMHHARDVGALDIALIDPDKQFTFKVPKYAKLKLTESEIEIPPLAQGGEGGVGVMAVTVSSKTLEATALVIQSNLDVVVKSSRDEVFVFAENMHQGKAWQDVRLLVSNGSQIVAQGTTGKDGVWRGGVKDIKELKNTGDVRVFALADGHVASNLINLSGVSVAQGLADKGYVYSERPAYRPGQVVHLRGVIRRAKDDAFIIDKDRKYTVDVFDSRNRLLWQKDVSLSDFGSFHVNFLLPTASVQGHYRAVVRDKDGKTYQGSFQVHQYQLEPVELVVDTPRTVYYRGEEVTGTITARFYYGAPLAGREIRYRLASGRIHTAKTNDKGQVEFKLPTRDLRQSQPIPLAVMLPERNLQVAKTLVLATQGFSIDVTTVRDVYLAGDTFEVRVKASDPEGEPVARELTLNVLERTKVDGRLGERSVAKHNLKTDKDGVARHTLRLEEGGQFILRVEGKDRFENLIAGARALKISDDDDEVRLRILADKHTFHVGETAQVQLHWREEPALALVTFEGAKVLDYRLVSLKKGANKLPLPMAAKLAPNFDLSVTVMTNAVAKKDDDKPPRRFHTASSPFEVQRDLRVKIHTKRPGGAKGPVRPGEEVEVTITTTDAAGKPIAAELSLAMVEKSLLDRFSGNIASIADFFHGGQRRSAFRTTSSVTFQYQAPTTPINPSLLKEEERVAVKEAEDLRREALVIRGAMPNGRTPAMPPPGIVVDTNGSTPFPAGPGGMIANDAPPVAMQPQAGGEVFGSQLHSLGQMPGRAHFGGAQGGFGGMANSMPSTQQRRPSDGGWHFNPPANANDHERDFLSGPEIGNLTASAFNDLRNKQRSLTLLGKSGEQRELNLAVVDGENAKRLIQRLNNDGVAVLLGAGPSETGYWNPSIVTDAKGKATLKITVPDRSTAWKLLAKGVTAETLAGEAEGELTAKKDLFGQLKLPLAFTDGDKATVQATVHNDLVAKGKIEVTLKTTIGEKTVSQRATVDVTAKGIQDLTFDVTAALEKGARSSPGASAAFELVVTAGETRDVVRRSVPIQPDGMPVFVASGGSAQSDTTALVDPPKDIKLQGPSLQVIIGPTVERGLLDIVLGSAPVNQQIGGRWATGLERASGDLLASLALQSLLKTTQQAGGPEAAAIDARIRSSLSLLIASQQKEGAWSWTGRGGAANRFASARAVWALSLAKASGYAVPDDVMANGTRFLAGQVAATASGDNESKAVLLHALAAADRDDFTLANRLFRFRANLSNAGLAYLSLALVEMDRAPMAAELLKLLAARQMNASAQPTWATVSWNDSSTETRAIFALAAQGVPEQAAKARQLVDWLMAHRSGNRWSPEKATGPAALAVCRHFAQNKFKREDYKLEVFVNDVRVKTLELTDDSGTQIVDVPARLLKDGRQRVNFQMTGRGRFSYQCIYGGFVATDDLKSTTNDWIVVRHFEPAPREVEGRAIPRGFGVLQGTYEPFRNPLTQLPVGQRGHVELRIRRRLANVGAEQRRYLVVTEPLPSGAAVIEQSIKGAFDRYEIGPGEITFYIGSRSGGSIHYDIHGYLPGSFRAGRTVLRNAYQPGQLAVATAKKLAVLPISAKSSDAYKLTPQELFELGRHHFARQQFAQAEKLLAELFNSYNLKPAVYQQTARMLLDVHHQIGPAAKLVRYFEINIEKWPGQEIPLGMISKVAAAYHEIGEYERSYLVYRAGVEGSFARDSQVAGFLEGEKEFARSVRVMDRLLREYPPEPYVAAANYALAQRVYAKAPTATQDAKLREASLTKVDLVQQALKMLNNFITAYPEDPAADQAAFSVGIALLELEAYDRAIATCQRFAKRYADSDYLDSYWYTIGFSQFALGKHEEALAMCQKVSAHKRNDRRSGREMESQNKWRAIYIMGQVHHSLGQAAEAIREYTRVKGRFSDAKDAIEYFARKDIKLPEVTTIRPGKPAVVKLSYRNVPECETRVYRIDLMKFSLLRRNLANITKINLAGIRPLFESSVKLGDGKDFQDKSKELNLALKKEGAYLVVCRGEDLHASGLVLVTPLKLDVQEDPASGRVRATVKDTMEDSFLPDVHVKIIGTGNQDFTSGETDLRGIFVADQIQGQSTIVARAEGGRYAFHRGKTHLGARPAPSPRRPSPKGRAGNDGKNAPASPSGDLLKGLRGDNFDIQQQQQQELQKLFDKKGTGVQGGGFF